jgi:histone-lysine N-methyltransferase SETMAR
MCTVFWDRQGVLLVEFLPQGTTINSSVYCETLKNKRRGMLSATTLLLHDNARPHSFAQTQDLITSFKWEQMDQPPYSPDLAPSDYHLFLHLKKFLGGKRFDDSDDLKIAVSAAAFYEEGLQKLMPPLR